VNTYLIKLLFTLLGVTCFAKAAVPLAGWALSTSPPMVQLGRLQQEPVCEATTLRIMPLGDSITHGATVPGGYRIRLWERILADRSTVDFVGSGVNGPATIDGDHEGHPGKAIQFIREGVRGWLYSGRPHIVLLMIGTNDVLYPEAHNFDEAAARLDALVGQITAIAPNTELIVASVPTLREPIANDRARSFSQDVQAIVNNRADQGRPVTFVDMYSVLNLEDLADGVHPNERGYEKMAEVWYTTIDQLLERRCHNPVDLLPPSDAGSPLEPDAPIN
jgi:lysophospholipase L1-like esterase